MISEVGERVDLAIGDEVFGDCEQQVEGAYAQRVAVSAAVVAKKRPESSHIDTAALALIGSTAMITDDYLLARATLMQLRPCRFAS